MITVKEYAESHGVTIQSIYQQINRESNKKALEGHISQNETGTKLLDDFAVEYLSKKSIKKNGTAVIVQSDSEMSKQLLVQENEIKRLNALVMSIENKYLTEINDLRKESNEKIEDLRQDKERLLKENKEIEVRLTKSQADINIREQENNHLKEDLEKSCSEKEQLKTQIDDLQKMLDEEKHKSFWKRLFG